MKLLGEIILFHKNDKLRYSIDLPNLNSEQVSRLKELGRKKKPAKIDIEIEEPILDDIEKRYLNGVISSFKNRIVSIQKRQWNREKEYLCFDMKYGEPSWELPIFKENTMYKGMELNKKEELEL